MIEERSPEEKESDSFQRELDDLVAIINDPAWGAFVNIMRGRREYLIKEICSNTRRGLTRDADRAQAKLEDLDKIVKPIRARLKALQEGRG